MPSLTFSQFHNALRIMLCIERHELAAAGITLSAAQWWEFRTDPFRWFLSADDRMTERLWWLIESRQPQRAPALAAAE